MQHNSFDKRLCNHGFLNREIVPEACWGFRAPNQPLDSRYLAQLVSSLVTVNLFCLGATPSTK